MGAQDVGTEGVPVRLSRCHLVCIQRATHHCILRALQSPSPYRRATRAGSQGEDEQS